VFSRDVAETITVWFAVMSEKLGKAASRPMLGSTVIKYPRHHERQAD
jgi:hypothetical protein